jgi:ATP-dependent RNA helicase DHX37/DHR1
VVLDEAHERSVNTDVLLGLLSRAVGLRNTLAAEEAAAAVGAVRAHAAAVRAAVAAGTPPPPAPPPAPLPLAPLKLIIMSATLRVDDFAGNAALWPPGGPLRPPPVLRVQARQWPVTVHFAKRTPLGGEYVAEAERKTAKIHTRLPPGGVLVFLTGQDEVDGMVARLRARFDARALAERAARRAAAAGGRTAGGGGGGGDGDGDGSASASSSGSDGEADSGVRSGDDSEGGSGSGSAGDGSGAEDAGADPPAPPKARGSSGDGALGDDGDGGGGAAADADDDDAAASPALVLPLYAILPGPAQQRVFQPPPEGTRLIVVATNVAETSLTIPGIRCVMGGGDGEVARHSPPVGFTSLFPALLRLAARASGRVNERPVKRVRARPRGIHGGWRGVGWPKGGRGRGGSRRCALARARGIPTGTDALTRAA